MELCRKLIAKGYAQEMVDDVLPELVQENLQSDARFAETYTRMRANYGFGPLRIQLELHERGVASDIISQCINENDAMWFAKLVEVKAKKFGNNIPADFQARAKQMKFLQYRGFNSEQIKSIFEN